MAADYFHSIRDPQNPESGRIDAVFPADLTLNYYKYTPVRYKNLIAAKYVLDNVKRIFSGVREFNQGGWCYAGRPRTWFLRENEEVGFPGDLLFAVYLNPRMRVYECRAERRSPDDPFCPEGWRDRYRGLVWKSTS